MIRLSGVTKTYKIGLVKRTVIDDLTIDLPTDRRLAIFGLPSGGKTTLTHLITGLIEPTKGDIDRFAHLSVPVGYQKSLKLTLSPRQNLTYACRVYGADVAEVSSFLARVTGLGDLMDEPLKKLAVQERMGFASALSYALPFDTYVVDGSHGGGTPEFRRKCLAMLEARAETNGVIYVTSHKTIAVRLCDMGGLLHDGKLTLYDDIEEAVEAFERLEAEVTMNRDLSNLEGDLDAAIDDDDEGLRDES